MRDIVEPTVVDDGGTGGLDGAKETHPAWAMIGASRVQSSNPGAVLFDSEMRHGHYVVIKLQRAERRRDLNRDWLFANGRIVEVAMSEAQWASFVSSMNIGGGVPCTLTHEGLEPVPGMPFAPRLQESLDEVESSAKKALERIEAATRAVEEKPTKANIRALRLAVDGAPNNMRYAAESLTEHAENTVQKARADLEAMVLHMADRAGLEPGDVGVPQIGSGD